MVEKEPAQWLDSTRQLKSRVRKAALPLWPALLIFGLVVLGAVPLYLMASFDAPSAGSTSSPISFRTVGMVSSFGGSQPAWYLGAYWMLTIPLGFGLAWAFYRRHTARVGLGDRSLPFVVAGAALFGVLFLLSRNGIGHRIPGDLTVRGLLPLAVVSLALGVLSVLAKSRAIAVFAAGFIALTLVVNLYDVENLAFRLGWRPVTDGQWNLAGHLGLTLCGLVLLASAAFSFASTRWGRGASR
jgi:hypothetical protein